MDIYKIDYNFEKDDEQKNRSLSERVPKNIKTPNIIKEEIKKIFNQFFCIKPEYK